MSPFFILIVLAVLSILLLLLLSFGQQTDDVLDRMFGPRKK